MGMKASVSSSSSSSSFRTRLLHENGKSYGPFLLSGSSTIAELIGHVGYSHIVVDMEHSPTTDIPQLTSMLRAIDAAASARSRRRGQPKTTTTNGGQQVQHQNRPSNFPIVRAPSNNDAATTKRILDTLRLPSGIIFPMIESVKQAKYAVASTRYPPHYNSIMSRGGTTDLKEGEGQEEEVEQQQQQQQKGIRGCAHPFVRASDYGYNEHYYDIDSNTNLFTILQIESVAAIELIPKIGMIDGVDCLFLGPFDISCDMNLMGQFHEDGDVMKMIRYAEGLVRKTSQQKQHEKGVGVCLGGFQIPGRSLQEMFSNKVGYQFISGAIDLGLMKSAAEADFTNGISAMNNSNNNIDDR